MCLTLFLRPRRRVYCVEFIFFMKCNYYLKLLVELTHSVLVYNYSDS